MSPGRSLSCTPPPDSSAPRAGSTRRQQVRAGRRDGGTHTGRPVLRCRQSPTVPGQGWGWQGRPACGGRFRGHLRVRAQDAGPRPARPRQRPCTYQEQLQQQHQHKQQGLRPGAAGGAASWLDMEGAWSASSGPVCWGETGRCSHRPHRGPTRLSPRAACSRGQNPPCLPGAGGALSSSLPLGGRDGVERRTCLSASCAVGMGGWRRLPGLRGAGSGPSPQPGSLRREAQILRGPKTPALDAPSGVLRVPTALLTPAPQPTPGPGRVHAAEEGPGQQTHRRFWDSPIRSVPGKPEAWVPLSWFPAPGPSQGTWGPRVSMAVSSEHRGGGHTFRTPTAARSVLGSLQVSGDSTVRVAATGGPALPGPWSMSTDHGRRMRLSLGGLGREEQGLLRVRDQGLEGEGP